MVKLNRLVLGIFNRKCFFLMNGDFIYMLKDLWKLEMVINVVYNNWFVKVNNDREIYKM